MSYGDSGYGDPEYGGRGYGDSGYGDSGYGDQGDPTQGRSSGRASVPGGPAEPPTGRASVPGAVGRASVGRASVRRAAPDEFDPPPASRGGSGGSGRFGFLGRLGRSGRPGGKPTTAKARARQRRRRNWIIAGFAVFIMLAGSAVIGGTYVFAQVALPEELKLPESTTIYYADGVTEMAKIGTENRTLIPFEQMPRDVQHAVVSAEDRSFYTNSGIDVKGILRAAWNNVTGGERQGASTIEQQYARKVGDLKGGYDRKIKEAAIASKLNSKYSKDQIMGFYLNTVYLGRGAYGCEAAAQTYFGKGCKDLTAAEGMVLAGLIKDPEGDDPAGKGSPFDPTRNPESAKDRWEYIRQGMVDGNWVTKEQGDALIFPPTCSDTVKANCIRKYDPKQLGAQWGLDKPTGLVVHHVLGELSQLKDPNGNPVFTNLKNDGYKIITTIDKKMNDAAEAAANVQANTSPLFGFPANIQAAMVSVEPRTGRVKAYYGGPNGDLDFAGYYSDPVLQDGQPTGVGRHPMGSSHKVYTLAAALIAGYTINSYWDGKSPKAFPQFGRGTNNPVTNAGQTGSCKGGDEHCQLWEATVASLNIPFAGICATIPGGAAKVIDVAHAAGVQDIWGDDLKRIDLRATPGNKTGLGIESCFGQYAITVLDHAAGMATFAARGWAAPTHFVQKVEQRGQLKYAEQIKLVKIPGFTEQMADDMAWVLGQICQGNAPEGGRPAACKSGTWECQKGTNTNCDVSWVGYTAPDLDPKKNNNGLATAVWVGNKGDRKALKLKNGTTDMYGASGAGPVWKSYMNAALKGTPVVRFPEAKFVGRLEEGNAASPTPTPPPGPSGGPGPPDGTGTPTFCPIPPMCPTRTPTSTRKT